MTVVRSNPDPWLSAWQTAIVAAAGRGPVLEIGCGAGHDTAVLVDMGVDVVAFDIDGEAVSRAKAAAPAAAVSVQSVLDPFPLEGQGIGVVVASLSLHYFGWSQTRSIVHRIRRTLREGGLLLARFNSDQDVHHGAIGFPEIERGLYAVNGLAKRFFSDRDVDALFQGGWRVLSKEHRTSTKYERPKALWEVVVSPRRAGARCARSTPRP